MVGREEVSIRQILEAVAATWRIPVIAALAAGAILLATLAFARSIVPSSTTYLAQVQFPFPEAAFGRYPNGAKFLINELIDPAILTVVYEQLSLDQFGLDRAEFYTGFSVRPYAAPDSDAAERFRQLLADRRLSLAERERVEAQFRAMLDDSSLSTVEVAFTLRRTFAIPEEIGRAIVQKVPAVWAQQMIENRGVLRIPGFSVTDTILTSADTDNLPLPLAILSVIDGTRRLVRRIAEIDALADQGADAVFTVLQDGETKKGIPDAARDIHNMELRRVFRLRDALTRYKFEDGIEPLQTGVARRIQDLDIEIDETTKRAAATTSSLTRYVESMAGVKGLTVEAGRPSGSDSSTSAPPAAPGSSVVGVTSVPALTDSVIDKMVQLQSRITAAEQRFIALTTSKQYDLMRRAIALRAEQVWWKDLLEALRTTSAQREPLEQVQRAQLVEELHATVSEINTIWALLTRLEQIYAPTRFTHSARLYSSNALTRDIVRHGAVLDLPMGMVVVLGMIAAFLLMLVGRVLLHLRMVSS